MLFLLEQIRPETFFSRLNTKLSYYIEHPSKISLDPLESDYTPNAVIMKHLVGTLVRYANGGQFEPYLAEGFSSEKNGRRWVFKLRNNLKCQNGEAISAAGYISGFIKLARGYANRGPIPILSDMIGWQSFAGGGALAGLIEGPTGEIIFEFHNPVSSGFLEYLSMPYYGYFCAANFKNDKWATFDTIISSGPFTLDSLSADKKSAILNLREDWPLATPNAIRKVHYHGSIEPQSWESPATIVQKNLGWDDVEPKGFRKITGPPDLVRAIVLDKGPNDFFKDLARRKIFQSKIYEVQKHIPFRSKSANLAREFYASAKINAVEAKSSALKSSAPSKKLMIFTPTIETDESKFILSIATTALEELGWPYEVLSPSVNNSLTAIDIAKKDKFDIRITSVVAGSVMEPWVVEMMFCSNMGVSYPDPSGKICQKIRQILSSSQPYDVQLGGDEISALIHEDAAVIPIYHGRTTWYFSKDLDVSRISGDLIMPSFEDIGLAE